MAITKRLSTKPLNLRPPPSPRSSGLRGGAYAGPKVDEGRADIKQVKAYAEGHKGAKKPKLRKWP
jgi:hypothetical protein